MARLFGTRLLALLGSSLLVGLVTGCGDDFCEGGNCSCPAGHDCEFECEAPPCHVECEGENSSCIGECANGECLCGAGSSCDFDCASPPCHVDCEGEACTGVCANGECTCEEGSECEFTCASSPCHVHCEGDNERCDGECSNGSCTCGPDSSCAFECQDGNCSFTCGAGSECTATCPGASPGEQGCAFTSCAAGEVTLCDDGETLTCGAPCPPPPETDD